MSRRPLLQEAWIALVGVSALSVCSSCGHPSDKQLKVEFHAHKAELEAVVQMAQGEESSLNRIADTWACCRVGLLHIYPSDGSALGLSQARWKRYRQLFAQTKTDSGIAISADHSQVFFYRSSEGGMGAGSSKGYVYSRKSVAPLIESLDRFRESDCPDRTCMLYEELDKNWFLFFSR